MTTISSRSLACGMPLIVESIPGVQSVALEWYLPAGSATDPEPLQGLSPMWAELIFRGSADLDSRAQADALDRLGINRGADAGTFYLRLSATLLGDRLLDALPLIVDMVRRPRFDAEAIDPVRDLALQALESLADDPHERAALALRERHNPAPINRSGMGTPEGLAAITRDDVVRGWERQVRPIGSILAIAGHVPDSAAVGARLDQLLHGWSGASPTVTWSDAPAKGTYHHIDDKSSQVQIVLMHDAPPEPHPDSVPERLVSSILSGGMSARLFTEVREKRGLCYSVSESYSTDRDFGRCTAYVGTTPERAQESLDVLLAELERVNTPDGRAAPDEFARSLVGIKSRIILSGESTGARAAALAGDQHKLGRPRSLDEIARDYETLTLDRLNAYLARRTLGPATIVTLGPTALKRPA